MFYIHNSSSQSVTLKRKKQGGCPTEVRRSHSGLKRLEVYVLTPQAFSTSNLVFGPGINHPGIHRKIKDF